MSNSVNTSNQEKRCIRYFASANSGSGFVSFFDKVFDADRFERIFILKGGPGTGKSSLMKSCRNIAKKHNTEYEEILCSSDPDSLDGLIIRSNRGKIAFIDGTSPHTMDTKIPGVVDELIDLGKYWNPQKLTSYKEEIMSLQKCKTDSYKNAYVLLSSAEKCLKRKQELITECLVNEKLERAISRLFPSKATKNQMSQTSYKINNAISAKGSYCCNLYNEQNLNPIPVYGQHGAACIVIKAIQEHVIKNKYNVWISPSPLQPYITDGIYVKDAQLSFYDAGKYTTSSEDNKVKNINSERFLNQERLKEIKPVLRTLSHIYKNTMSCAYAELAKTRQYHFELENIYTQAMNFSKMEKEISYINDIVKAFCV